VLDVDGCVLGLDSGDVDEVLFYGYFWGLELGFFKGDENVFLGEGDSFWGGFEEGEGWVSRGKQTVRQDVGKIKGKD